MKEQGIDFEQARLKHMQEKYREAGCAPDGTPLDPKAVTPRDVRAAGGFEKLVNGGGGAAVGESPAVRVQEVMAEKRAAEEAKAVESARKRELKKQQRSRQAVTIAVEAPPAPGEEAPAAVVMAEADAASNEAPPAVVAIEAPADDVGPPPPVVPPFRAVLAAVRFRAAKPPNAPPAVDEPAAPHFV